ncbi:MAG: metallophosphoesterase [Ottowia sp.]|nr:metallophosphoesterase [Ottowia sp.]
MPPTVFLLRLMLVGAVFYGYVGLRLIPDLPVGSVGRWASGVSLGVLCVLSVAGILIRRIDLQQGLSDALAWVGFLAMGFTSSLFVLTVLRDVMMIFLGLISLWVNGMAPMMTIAAVSAIAVPVLALLATLVGLINARRCAQVVTVHVPIADLPTQMHGFRIVQISDLHVGPTIKRKYVDAIVEAVNALKPDMIAITGDVVDGSVAQLRRHTEPLRRLSAQHGVYLVTGNHEYYAGVTEWVAEFRRLGLCVLMNEHVVLEHQGVGAIVAGVTDYGGETFEPSHRSDPFAAIAGAPLDVAVKILLAHQPRTAPAAVAAGYCLQLSGHTHGGQFLPWNFFVRLQQPFVAGLHRVNNMWIYISRGTGYWGPPKRLGAPSEITELILMTR